SERTLLQRWPAGVVLASLVPQARSRTLARRIPGSRPPAQPGRRLSGASASPALAGRPCDRTRRSGELGQDPPQPSSQCADTRPICLVDASYGHAGGGQTPVPWVASAQRAALSLPFFA